MGRFDNRWSDEHRVAVTHAVLDDGLSVTETLRRAKAGKLAGLPPFDMPYSTARTYISREQHRRDSNRLATITAEDAHSSIHAFVRRMVDYIDRELSRLERARKPDYTGLERLIVAIGKLSKLVRELPPERSGDASGTHEGAIQSYTPAVEARIEAHRREQLGQPTPAPAPPPTKGSEPARNDYPEHARTTGEGGSGWPETREEIRAALTAGHEPLGDSAG